MFSQGVLAALVHVFLSHVLSVSQEVHEHPQHKLFDFCDLTLQLLPPFIPKWRYETELTS